MRATAVSAYPRRRSGTISEAYPEVHLKRSPMQLNRAAKSIVYALQSGTTQGITRALPARPSVTISSRERPRLYTNSCFPVVTDLMASITGNITAKKPRRGLGVRRSRCLRRSGQFYCAVNTNRTSGKRQIGATFRNLEPVSLGRVQPPKSSKHTTTPVQRDAYAPK